jgi:hypothetical protein
MKAWGPVICAAFRVAQVTIVENSDPALFRKETSVLTAAADHREKSILLYSPGRRVSPGRLAP